MDGRRGVEQETTIVRKERHQCAHVRDTHGGRHTTTRDVTAFGIAAGTQTLPPTTAPERKDETGHESGRRPCVPSMIR